MHPCSVVPQLTLVNPSNTAKSSLCEYIAVIIYKSSSINMELQFYVSCQSLSRFYASFITICKISLHSLFHIQFYLMHILSCRNHRSSFNVCAKIFSRILYYYKHFFHLYGRRSWMLAISSSFCWSSSMLSHKVLARSSTFFI